MSFYSEFAGDYESVFPLEERTYRFLLEHAPGRASVLDVGCGTGDYCGRFAADGRNATGIDLDPEMVVVATRRFDAATFHVMDMRGVSALRGPFDCVYCIGNVLSHLPPGELRRFLTDVHALLSEGGSWVLQTVNWDHVLRVGSFRFPDVVVPEGGLVFEREYPRVSETGTVFSTRLTRGGRIVFAGEVTLYPMRAGDCVGAHAAAGFRLRGHYSDFGRGAFSVDTMSASVFEFERG